MSAAADESGAGCYIVFNQGNHWSPFHPLSRSIVPRRLPGPTRRQSGPEGTTAGLVSCIPTVLFRVPWLLLWSQQYPLPLNTGYPPIPCYPPLSRGILPNTRGPYPTSPGVCPWLLSAPLRGPIAVPLCRPGFVMTGKHTPLPPNLTTL